MFYLSGLRQSFWGGHSVIQEDRCDPGIIDTLWVDKEELGQPLQPLTDIGDNMGDSSLDRSCLHTEWLPLGLAYTLFCT